MREIAANKITETAKNLIIEANTNLSEDVLEALNKALKNEKSNTGREILRQIIKNSKIALEEKLAVCQDTGFAIVFVEIGKNVQISGGDLKAAINEGVAQGYTQGYFRKSIVEDPIHRKNSGDNTPAIIHTEIVPGDKLKLTLLTKGGGAENCSAIKMFRPTDSYEEINEFILETVKNAGANACPPIIVGVGIGGTFDYAPVLAKKALLRKVGAHSSAFETKEWEKELLKKINQTGIGPMGLGGTTTALAVNIERHPCHISSLPVAINIDCHAHRVKEATL